MAKHYNKWHLTQIVNEIQSAKHTGVAIDILAKFGLDAYHEPDVRDLCLAHLDSIEPLKAERVEA